MQFAAVCTWNSYHIDAKPGMIVVIKYLQRAFSLALQKTEVGGDRDFPFTLLF